jgi:hypothetical protein
MDEPVAPKPVTEPPVVPDPCGDNGLLVANPTENMWKDAVDGQERGCGNWGQLNKEQRDYKTKIESEEACMQRCVERDWCMSYFWGFDKHAGKCILVGEPQCTKGNTYQPYRHKKMNRCTKREMPEETDAPAVTDAPVVTEPVRTKKPEPTTMPEEVCDEDRATGSFVAHGKCKGGRKLVCTQAESRYDCMMMAKMDTECSSVYSYYRSKSCFCQKKNGSNPECQMMEDRQYGIWRLN